MNIEKSQLIYIDGIEFGDLNNSDLGPLGNFDTISEAASTEALNAYAQNHLARPEVHEDGEWRLEEDGDLAPILALIQHAPEWKYLIGKVDVSPEAYEEGKQAVHANSKDSAADDYSSVAERANLSKQAVEVWRTTNAVDCTLTLCRGDGEGADWFRPPAIEGKLAPKALSDPQYAEFSRDLRRLAGDNEGFIAFILAEYVHDLAKSAALVEEAGKLGITIVGRDHDTILHDIISREDVCDKLLPTLAKVKEFSPKAYHLAINVLRINTNYAQLLTGEAPAHDMTPLLGIDPQVQGLFFFKHRLDIAGALGHRQHAGSLTMDRETYQDMVDLEWAITTDELPNDPVVRNNAYIRRRGLRLGSDVEAMPYDRQDEMYACIRLAMRRRVHEREIFEQILLDYNRLPDNVRGVLTALINREGVDDKAIRAGYSQAMLMGMAKDPQFSENYLEIYAMFLQEAAIYGKSKSPNETGVMSADLKDIATGINQKSITLGSAIRFRVKEAGDEEAMIYPELRKPAMRTLDSLGDFDGESLRGRRLAVIGMAGGADNLHAAALGNLLSQKYAATLAGVMTFRRPDQILHGGSSFGASGTLVNHGSEPRGNWSRGNIEKTLLETFDDNELRVAISNADNLRKRLNDLEAFGEMTGADVIIGVDPGGDSFSYRGDYPEDLAHLGTERDRQAIVALNALSSKHGLPVHSGVIAPDVYARDYSLSLMRQAGTQKLPLTALDLSTMVEIYDHMGMLHGEDTNYSTTAMLFHRAALGNLGLQSIDVPAAVATSPQNPWRVFFEVTPASANIAMTSIARHHAVISD